MLIEIENSTQIKSPAANCLNQRMLIFGSSCLMMENNQVKTMCQQLEGIRDTS